MRERKTPSRILAILLTLCLLLSLFPLSAAAVETDGSTVRYTVLVLDTSGSMSGAPAQEQKKAAKKFVSSLSSANGTNYVALIAFSSNASVQCEFTTDLSALQTSIDALRTGGSTNTNEALQKAGELLNAVKTEGAIKNIVLCSDGLPQTGATNYDGHYTSSDYRHYLHANSAYHTATALKESCYIYTLGFFHALSGQTRTFGERFMRDLQNAGYHIVENGEELEFVFGDIADDITQGKKTGTFSYASGSQDYTATYYYDDKYFAPSATEYNSHLATMSLCLALSAFGSNQTGYADKSCNFRTLTEELGFEDFITNAGFQQKPTRDSIGAAAANKAITFTENGAETTYTLVALAIRGGGYESEWASNFTIGIEGQHRGFQEASTQVLAFLESYLENQNISGPLKLWITGYSRAAATANLTAGAIDQNQLTLPENTTLDPQEDLFAYCFETPAGALTSNVKNNTSYQNIYNIINQSDPVTKVAPAAMGFGRYGIDRYLPTAENSSTYSTQKSKMLAQYNALDSAPAYTVDNFQMKEIKIDWFKFLPGGDPLVSVVDDTDNHTSQGAFLDDFITKLVKEFIHDRSTYVRALQDGVREVCGLFFGSSSSQTDRLIEACTQKITDNAGKLIATYINPFQGEDHALALMADYLIESLDEAGIDNYNESTVRDVTATLVDLLLAVASNHPNLTTTLVTNIEGIGQAHYPELCLAWLQSMDSYYTSDIFNGLSSGDYRVIHINCPVDVTVSRDGQTVGSIIGDNPQAGDVVTAINTDGEKLVYLPTDAGYEIDIQATGDGEVSISVNEFSAVAGENTRVVNYLSLPVATGDTFQLSLPKYTGNDASGQTLDGSNTSYCLKDSNEAIIYPTNDLKGTLATEAYYQVTVESRNETWGAVSGGGTYQTGQFAQVTAQPYQGYQFVGWYDGASLVSREETYRTAVTKDLSLTAVFAKKEDSTPYYTIQVGDTENGTVTCYAKSAAKGATVSVSVKPSVGYTLDQLTVTDAKGNLVPVTQTSYNKYAFVMPAAGVTIDGVFSQNTPAVLPFLDVKSGDWFYEALEYVYKNGLMNGVENDLFAPNATLSRAMAVTILYRLDGSPSLDGENLGYPFADVESDAWYGNAVYWARLHNIVDGVGDNNFSPNASLTREQMAAMLYRYITYQGGDVSAKGDLTAFADGSSVSNWAKDAMTWAVGSGYLNGVEGNALSPQGTSTRAQTATVLMRFGQALNQ